MRNVVRGGLSIAILLILVFAAGLLVLRWFGGAEQLLFAIWAAFFLAMVTPVTIIAIRHQIRRSRIKLIELFAKTFDFESGSSKPAPPGAKAATNGNVSFEFVKGKYLADLDDYAGDEPALSDVPRYPMMLQADWMLLLCAIPYMVLAWFGAFLLFAPVVEVMNIGKEYAVGAWLWPSMLALGGADLKTINTSSLFQSQHANVLTVAVVAFSGAYFYSLRLLLRAVTAFDLSPITFLRGFAHILLSMLLAIIIYRVFPSGDAMLAALGRIGQALQTLSGTPVPAVPPVPDAQTCAVVDQCAPGDPAAGVSSLWLITAFALGFIPDAALQFVLQKSGFTFKERYGDLDPHAKLVPLTVIDGIDSFIAFRLEESNIFDVQNLAAANPIMLHIESPFGIYETIDWVAQAQLCTVTGPDRFLLLKTFNIRTIFDLERAVMKPLPDQSVPPPQPPPADAAVTPASLVPAAPHGDHAVPPDQPQPASGLAATNPGSAGASGSALSTEDESVVRMIGEMLVRDNIRDKAMRKAFDLGPPAYTPGLAGNQTPSVEMTRHMVAVMIDDLHVHRLRQVWKHMVDKLGVANARL